MVNPLQSNPRQNAEPSIEANYHFGDIKDQQQWIPLVNLPLNHVDPNYPKLVLLISSIIMFVLYTVIVGILFINQTQLIGVILAILLAAVSFALVKLMHTKAKRVMFGVFEHEFVMREGVFWVSTTALPYTRLQHVNISQGPIERHFKIVSIKCFSAGSGQAEIDLPGINAEQAEQLRQHILHCATSHNTSSDTENSLLSQPLEEDVSRLVDARENEYPLIEIDKMIANNSEGPSDDSTEQVESELATKGKHHD